MNRWFSFIERAVARFMEATSLWNIFSEMRDGFLFTVSKKAMSALATCILALGGAIVGTITGAMKGQTTETGLLRGAGIGAVAGAITAVQLMELMVNGEPFSKFALLCSLANGKVFMEWVSPAVLKAYQWQISANETGFGEISDIFEVTAATKGLSQEYIKNLPRYKMTKKMEIACTICLQDLKNGDWTRRLPTCRHDMFHLHCIDQWLTRQGSCPVCRHEV